MLSAYMHLIKNPKAIQRYHTYFTDRQRNITWTDFIDLVTVNETVMKPWKNVHWTPQSELCMFKKFWPLYNFVGNFENVTEHAKLLDNVLGIQNYSKCGSFIIHHAQCNVSCSGPRVGYHSEV
jgi:hypothetical protein